MSDFYFLTIGDELLEGSADILAIIGKAETALFTGRVSSSIRIVADVTGEILFEKRWDGETLGSLDDLRISAGRGEL